VSCISLRRDLQSKFFIIFLHISLEREFLRLSENIRKQFLIKLVFYLSPSINIHSRFKVLHKVSKYIKPMFNYIHDNGKTKSRVYTPYGSSKSASIFACVHSTVISSSQYNKINKGKLVK